MKASLWRKLGMMSIMAVLALGGLAGCEDDEGAAEQVGENVEQAAEEVSANVEEMGQEIEEAAEEVED